MITTTTADALRINAANVQELLTARRFLSWLKSHPAYIELCFGSSVSRNHAVARYLNQHKEYVLEGQLWQSEFLPRPEDRRRMATLVASPAGVWIEQDNAPGLRYSEPVQVSGEAAALLARLPEMKISLARAREVAWEVGHASQLAGWLYRLLTLPRRLYRQRHCWHCGARLLKDESKGYCPSCCQRERAS